ncbi:MAG: homoserine kinase type II [Polyangiales bacterium]|jgi:homoserine kinase type II
MAAYTPLSLENAEAIFAAHRLGVPTKVVPIAAGSVNSNYFVEGNSTYFVRLYEEQDAAGVAYEWALLEQLFRAGVPMPSRIEGPGPGVLRVEGRSVAVFERVPGEMRCQSSIRAPHLEQLGAALARAHLATAEFGWRRESRFRPTSLMTRLDELDPQKAGVSPALLKRIRALLAQPLPTGVPRGPIHGDLFRDNVLWNEDETLSALLDWESAAEGAFVADLAVVFLSWCMGDELDWSLGRALVGGYEEVRPLSDCEKRAFFDFAISMSARFALTRITDFHLRTEELRRTGSLIKDYQRFVQRLDQLESLGPREVLLRLS